MNRILQWFGCLAWLAAISVAHADEPAAVPTPNPMAVLGAAKAASGGSTWNDLKTQHVHVTLTTAGLSGPVERWSEFTTGRSYLTYALGATSGAAGFDGSQGWTQNSAGESRFETEPAARELAVNAAYRDQLAFWFPSRHPAAIVYKAREHRDDADFDIVSITPQGGREFDLWINADTHLIERLVEHEAVQTRTEYYMDFREVAGVRVPFRVRATRGDTRFDEIVTIDSIDFDAPSSPVDFAKPAPRKPDFTFPAGKSSVEVPFTLASGHIYIDVTLGGKGPMRMLVDSGGAGVLTPDTARVLAPGREGATAGTGNGTANPASLRVPSMDVAGITLTDQAFVTLPIDEQFTRIEGVDHVAGIVGYELFRRFPVRIDYQRRRITFYDPAGFRYQGAGTRVPIRFHDDIPEVDGSLDGIAGVFDIDTGSRSSLILTAPFATRNDLANRYHATAEVTTGAGIGGPSRTRVARATMLKLGDVEVPQPVTLLSTATSGALADESLAGNVGYGVLHRFNLVFDYRNDVIWFEKNAQFAERDVHDRAGVWVERGAAGFTVVDVLPGGPAAVAGLKVGDVIRAVDGKPASKMTLDALRARLRAPPGTRVKLEIGGRGVDVVLKDLA